MRGEPGLEHIEQFTNRSSQHDELCTYRPINLQLLYNNAVALTMYEATDTMSCNHPPKPSLLPKLPNLQE